MGLSPALAKKLLEANVVNLATKVKDGKPLTAQELALVQAVASDGEVSTSSAWATDQVQLAELLGVNRKTIARWIKIDGHPITEADGRYNVAAWREFKKTHGRGGGEVDDLDKGTLQAKNLLLQNERLEWQINILKKEYVPVIDVTKWGAELGAEVAKRLNMIPSLSASLVGLSVPDCELRLREIVDEALGSLHLLDERIQSAEREAVEAAIEAEE